MQNEDPREKKVWEFLVEVPYDVTKHKRVNEYLRERCEAIAAEWGREPSFPNVKKVFYLERKSGLRQVVAVPGGGKEHTQWDEKEDSAEFNYEGLRSFVTLEEALEFCKADLDVWEVERHVFNSWDVTMKGPDKMPMKRTNYQVKIWFRRKVDEMPVDEWIAELEDRKRPFIIPRHPGSGIGVFKLADFHFGAEVSKIILTPDFNFNVLTGFLQEIVEIINSRKYDKVYISLLGDFIESFTGLMHKDTWKGLSRDAYGIKIVKHAHNMLKENLYSQVKNLVYVGFVSGNHDRVSNSREEDAQGGAAEALHWAFEMEVDIESEWHPLLISKMIDGINYIDTHGHHKLSKKDIAQMVFDYGVQDCYNVFCKGHYHSREAIKRFLKKMIKVEDHRVVDYDSANFRAVTVPPLFTGNFYSESNAWSSTAGFVEFWNNGRGKPHFLDYTL